MGSGAAATIVAINRLSQTMPVEGEKVFTCPTCNRAFNKKANLKVHSRKHTGEKPYSCSKPGCGRSFMWKSSVSFHEQNCPSARKDTNNNNNLNQNNSNQTENHISLATKGVQKRPKSIRSSSSSYNNDHSPKSTKSNTNNINNINSKTIPTTPITPEDLNFHQQQQPRIRDDVILTAPTSRPPRLNSDIITSTKSLSTPTTSAITSTGFLISPPPLPTTPTVILDTNQPLPAPATLLAEKRPHGISRPPVIPGSLPKHFLVGHKDTTNATKLFDLRVPSTPVYNSSTKMQMPKMPIAMDLDDSDDEGPTKIVGAQDAFMRTGNPFVGFAPPTRCSPLPVSSPIVCPGSSPMPLSPLAPFSPLPPDSPAHNAPNPVHPPVYSQSPRPPSGGSWLKD